MQEIQILFSGLQEVKTFDDLLEALEFVVAHHQHGNFLIKPSLEAPWEDGAYMFKQFQKMFAPIKS